MDWIIYLEVFILAIVCAIPFLIEKKYRFYSPPQTLSFIYFAYYGIPAIYMINNMSLFLIYPHVRTDYISVGMVFIIFAYILFLIGYYLPFKDKNLKKIFKDIILKLPDLSTYKIEIKNFPFIISIFFILGWISRFLLFKWGIYSHTEAGEYALRLEGFKFYQQYIYLLSILPTFSILLLFSKWLKNENKFFFNLGLFFLLIDFIYYLPTGSKERALMPLFLVMTMYSLRKKIPFPWLFLSGIFFVFFIIPYTNIFKSVYKGRLLEDLMYSTELYLDIFSGKNKKFFEELMYYTFGLRLNYTEVVTNIVTNTPYVWDFQKGYTYMLFFIALIPRFLWVNKPEVGSMGYDFGIAYGYNLNYGQLSSVDMSWVGEMFLNFGWYGILCGFFYGLLYSFIYHYFLGRGKLSELSMIFYVLAFYFMTRSGTFASQFGELLKDYLVLYISLFLFIRKVKS
jgi:hypothetical protein